MFSGSFHSGISTSLRSTGVKAALATETVSPRSLLKPMASLTRLSICLISASASGFITPLASLR